MQDEIDRMRGESLRHAEKQNDHMQDVAEARKTQNAKSWMFAITLLVTVAGGLGGCTAYIRADVSEVEKRVNDKFDDNGRKFDENKDINHKQDLALQKTTTNQRILIQQQQKLLDNNKKFQETLHRIEVRAFSKEYDPQ